MVIIEAYMTFGINFIFSHLLHGRTVENAKTFPDVPVFLI